MFCHATELSYYLPGYDYVPSMNSKLKSLYPNLSPKKPPLCLYDLVCPINMASTPCPYLFYVGADGLEAFITSPSDTTGVALSAILLRLMYVYLPKQHKYRDLSLTPPDVLQTTAMNESFEFRVFPDHNSHLLTSQFLSSPLLSLSHYLCLSLSVCLCLSISFLLSLFLAYSFALSSSLCPFPPHIVLIFVPTSSVISCLIPESPWSLFLRIVKVSTKIDRQPYCSFKWPLEKVYNHESISFVTQQYTSSPFTAMSLIAEFIVIRSPIHKIKVFRRRTFVLLNKSFKQVLSTVCLCQTKVMLSHWLSFVEYFRWLLLGSSIAAVTWAGY